MGRSRSTSRERYRRGRSRSRERYRKRSRSRDRYDSVQNEYGEFAMQVQQQQLAALQQQMTQQMQGVGGLETDAQAQEKKQRELYVGNLPIGAMNAATVEDFFNQALSHLVPDPNSTPPVLNVNMEGHGRFAFVELRDRHLANQALLMDKIVEIHGRFIHIGRPKGFIENFEPAADQTKMPELGITPVMDKRPTRALLLSNLLRIIDVRGDREREELKTEVEIEAGLHGNVEAVAVPSPPETAQDRGAARAYILYKTIEDAQKAQKIFNKRTLNDNIIRARFVSEGEFDKAQNNEWTARHQDIAGVSLPGLYTITPYSSGVYGLTVLNPSLASLIQSNPKMAGIMVASIEEEEVPFEEGWVKLRGFPASMTKQEIIDFFHDCGDISEEDIKLVHSADKIPLGEAYVHLKGPDAKLRLALSRDKSNLPTVNKPAEVMTCFEDDLNRRILAGCQLL